MKAGTLVAAVTVSGILGGIVGALLVQAPSAPPAPAVTGAPSTEASDRAESLSKEVADLRARLEEMQGSVTASAQDSSKLRMELDREHKAASLARSRLESLEMGGAGHAPGDLFHEGLAVEGGAVPIPLGRIAMGATGLSARMKKTLELMGKPEDERWAAIREALSLTDLQEQELKAALKERDLAMRDMTKIESHEVTGPDGNVSNVMRVSAPDPEKVRETRRKYDDRVNASLTADQSKKWKDEGYEAAAGGGGAMVFTSVTTDFGEK